MKLIGKEILYDFKQKHVDSISQIDSWIAEIEIAQWNSPHDLKQRYSRASLLGDQKVIFDICGNRYRLFIIISYKNQVVLVKKIGTHEEYNKWNLN